GNDMEAVRTFTKEILQPTLEKLPEVRTVQPVGMTNERITVSLDKQAIDDKQIHRTTIIQTLQQLNDKAKLQQASGDEMIFDTSFHDFETIKDVQIPLETEPGYVRLHEIAQIEQSVEEKATDTWKNGKDNALI